MNGNGRWAGGSAPRAVGSTGGSPRSTLSFTADAPRYSNNLNDWVPVNNARNQAPQGREGPHTPHPRRQLHINFLASNQLHPGAVAVDPVGENVFGSKVIPQGDFPSLGPNVGQLRPASFVGQHLIAVQSADDFNELGRNGNLRVRGRRGPGSPDSVSSVSRLIGRPTNTASLSSLKRPRGRSRLFAVIATLALLVGALLIGLLIITYYFMKNLQQRNVEICQTTQCVRTAASLLRSMDPTVSPCTDFYQFACGRWVEDHPPASALFSNGWFYEKRESVTRNIQEFLIRNNTPDEAWAVHQARILYSSCMDVVARDALGLEPAFNVLDSVEMPRMPPMVATKDWNWVRTAALTRRKYNFDLIIGLLIFPENTNRTVNKMHIGSFRTGSPLPDIHAREDRLDKWRDLVLTLPSAEADGEREGEDSGEGSGGGGEGATSPPPEDDEDYKRFAKAYTAFIANTITLFLNKTGASKAPSQANDPSANTCGMNLLDVSTDVADASKEVVMFERMLLRLTQGGNNTEDDDGRDMWVWELQNLTEVSPEQGASAPINWTEYLTVVFEGVKNVKLDFNVDKVVVHEEDFLRGVAALLSKTPVRTLQLFMWWRIVEMLAPYLTTEMHLLVIRYREAAGAGGGPPQPPRDMFCAEVVNSMMGMAVSVMYVTPDYLNTTGKKVGEMLTDVRESFEYLLYGLEWMDPATKVVTLDKVQAMKSFIGYPQMLLNPKELDKFYAGVNVTQGHFLENMLSFENRLAHSSLNSLHSSSADDEWATDPTDVNAFHTFQANSVTVPAAILQFPFYDLGLEALNYGAIGTILGHELTHGFDNTGRLFDKDGNQRPWWSNATVTEYENRTACFVKQYSEYYIADVDQHVDGELTLGENIADNGGMHQALMAYRRYERRTRTPESRLPGMANYTTEQLFYLAFAHLWCSTETKASIRLNLEDVHSPPSVRTLAVLSNSEDFARAWNCPRGSPMNPEKGRCRLW